ncbi:MAG: [FeFe] hydrogenase H-cluster radical SAM maturase HydE [Clostridiaceae bacterium]|nr:[FeFe] hydrogenase H-cluster radical SAM maturase HydE [Clostridiaceae bacterium]
MRSLHRKALIELLQSDDAAFTPIFEEAGAVCKEHFGDTVKIRALLEFSNICRRQCIYCGLNCKNSKPLRFRLEPDEIVSTALEAADSGYQTIVLQSGEDPYFTPELLGDIVRQIKSACPAVAVTLSCGEFPAGAYRYFKSCGADRYLLKHETSDPHLYQMLHPDSCLAERLRCQRDIKAAGLEAGGGFMIGLPGQSIQTIADDLLTLQSIPCDMAGIGPFLPHPDTPLGDAPHGSAMLTLRAVALARLLLPRANLPVTTALGVLDRTLADRVYSCGGNVVMRKVTPLRLRKLYQIYPAEFEETTIPEGRRQIEQQILQLGKIPI